jgi:hypothetical protein
MTGVRCVEKDVNMAVMYGDEAIEIHVHCTESQQRYGLRWSTKCSVVGCSIFRVDALCVLLIRRLRKWFVDGSKREQRPL